MVRKLYFNRLCSFSMVRAIVAEARGVQSMREVVQQRWFYESRIGVTSRCVRVCVLIGQTPRSNVEPLIQFLANDDMTDDLVTIIAQLFDFVHKLLTDFFTQTWTLGCAVFLVFHKSFQNCNDDIFDVVWFKGFLFQRCQPVWMKMISIARFLHCQVVL